MSAEAPSKLFNLPFTAFDVACCMGKESVCKMLLGVLHAQPGADWWQGSLELFTSQASAIAEYVQDQEKHTRCVQLLKRCTVLAELKSKLYKSVEQGDEKEVLALLKQVSISGKGEAGDLMRGQLMALAANNLQVLALLQNFGKVNTPAHLQLALLELTCVLDSEKAGSTEETLLARARPHFAQAQNLVEGGVVLRGPKSKNDQANRVCLEEFLSKLCADESKYIPSIVNLLLEARVDPNAARVQDDRTPLFRACLKGGAETVKLLLNAKASADIPAIRLTYDSDTIINTTPLVAAVLRADSGAVTKLVLDALRWRVSKTGLAALVSMAPLVRKLEMVRPPIYALSSRHA